MNVGKSMGTGVKMPNPGGGEVKTPFPASGTTTPNLKPMGMQGNNPVKPQPQIANAASGPAHLGGTADPQGINFAIQKNMGHFHPTQTPMQPQMNPQMQQPPMVPGGMMAKKMGAMAAKDANWLTGIAGNAMKGVSRFLKTPAIGAEAKAIGAQAAPLAENAVSHAAPALRQTGHIPGTSIRNVIDHGGPPSPTHVMPHGAPAGPPALGGSVTVGGSTPVGAGSDLASKSYGRAMPGKPTVSQSAVAPVWKPPTPAPQAGELGEIASANVPQVQPKPTPKPNAWGAGPSPAVEGTANGPPSPRSDLGGLIQEDPFSKPTAAEIAGAATRGAAPEAAGAQSALYSRLPGLDAPEAAGVGAEAAGAASAAQPWYASAANSVRQAVGSTARSVGEKAKGFGGGTVGGVAGYAGGDVAGEYLDENGHPYLANVARNMGPVLGFSAGYAGAGLTRNMPKVQKALLGAGVAGATGAGALAATHNPYAVRELNGQGAQGPTPAGAQPGAQPGAPGAPQTAPTPPPDPAASQAAVHAQTTQPQSAAQWIAGKLGFDTQGMANMQKLQSNPAEAIKDPAVRQQIAGVVEKLKADPEGRKFLAEQSYGKAGGLFADFMNLPPIAQTALVAALFMGIGGLMGGGQGALAGGLAGGLGTIILQNMPAITAALHGQGGATENLPMAPAVQ